MQILARSACLWLEFGGSLRGSSFFRNALADSKTNSLCLDAGAVFFVAKSS